VPHPYLTHYAPHLVQPRCTNEYFSKSKWVFLLSLCWHGLQLYRWGISARHIQSAGIMYQDIKAQVTLVFLFFSVRRGLYVDNIAAVTEV